MDKNTYKKGIDISCWQEDIDLKKAKKDGIDFVIIRDGFATTEDSCYEKFVHQSKEADLDIPAIYHFSYALNDNDAKKEGAFAVSQARRMGLPEMTKIFFDFEYASIEYCQDRGIEPMPEMVRSWAKTFADEVKKHGYIPGIYTNYDLLRRFYGEKFVSNYEVWFAYWTDDVNDAPDIDHTCWQTGSEYGIGGIPENVDTDLISIKMEEKTYKNTTDGIVRDVIAGKWGNGKDRYNRLTEAGYNYDDVQNKVNEALNATSVTNRKNIEEIAKEVIIGDWGNGLERVRRLRAAGYDPEEVQDMVNKKYY